MKALVYHGNKDIRIESVEDPVPGPGEVKLRMDYCGICATDIEEYLYGPKFLPHEMPNPITGNSIPIVTGHEITGTVAELGENVESFQPGDRVVLNSIVTCGECWWCRHGEATPCPNMAVAGFAVNGGLAQYMTWPASQAIKLPDHVTSEEAALTEPTSVAHHAVRRGRIEPGQRVGVLGAGTVGMLAMQIAKAKGAEVFAVDTRQMSLDMAKELGADGTVNVKETDAVQELQELTDGIGADVVIDAAGGRDTPALAVELARTGGRVVLVAIYTSTPEFDFNSVVMGEKEVVGSLAFDQDDVEEAVRLIASGSVRTKPLVSDIISLDDVIDVGFARMLAPTKDVFRILVAPNRAAMG